MTNMPDDFYIFGAERNNKDSAIELIQRASLALKSGNEMSIDLKDYLSRAFDKIVDGKSADKSLYLNTKKGRPKGDNALKVYCSIEFLVKALGWKKEAAFDYVSNSMFIDRETVVKHYYENRKIQDFLFDQFKGKMESNAELKYQMMYLISELCYKMFEEYLSIVRK